MIRRRQAPVLLLLCLLMACAGPLRLPLSGHDDHGSVQGLVTVEQVEGGDRLVTVSASELPPPARLNPDLRTYVVWFEPGEGEPIRAGELTYEPQYREGRLHAATPLERFQLEITAERSGDAATPSDHVIVTQWVDEG